MTETLVTTPYEMACVLVNASARNAPSFARASHETACERGDEERIDFWRDVCRDVDALHRQLEQPSLKVA